jgi:hypothetical protein
MSRFCYRSGNCTKAKPSAAELSGNITDCLKCGEWCNDAAVLKVYKSPAQQLADHQRKQHGTDAEKKALRQEEYCRKCVLSEQENEDSMIQQA